MCRTIVHFTYFYIAFIWTMDQYRSSLKLYLFDFKIIFHYLYRNLAFNLCIQVTTILYENIFFLNYDL